MSVFDIALEHDRQRAAALNPYGLDAHERALAALIMQGMTTAQAGDQLGLSLHAAEACRTQVAQKLGASCEAQLLHILATLPSPGPGPERVYIDDFRQAFGATHLRLKSSR